MIDESRDFIHFIPCKDMHFSGKYDIPKMKPIRLKNINTANLIGFNYATNKLLPDKDQRIVHFFLQDSVFERVWRYPSKYIEIFGEFKAIISPDFSQYTTMPTVMRIWNHYRKMWLSQYYTERGIHVIPAPCWSDESSFEYCFDGMPKNSALCISTVGCITNKDAYKAFILGFKETLNRLEPAQLLMYGVLTPEIEQMIPCEYISLKSDQKQRIQEYNQKKALLCSKNEPIEEVKYLSRREIELC